MKWNRRNVLTLNTYSDKYSCNSHWTAEIPRDGESECVMRDNVAWFLLTQCVTHWKATVSQMYIYTCIPAQQLIAVQKCPYEFSGLVGLLFNKAQEEGEFRNQLWLWVLLQHPSVILGHSPLNKSSIFSTWNGGCSTAIPHRGRTKILWDSTLCFVWKTYNYCRISAFYFINVKNSKMC